MAIAALTVLAVLAFALHGVWKHGQARREAIGAERRGAYRRVAAAARAPFTTSSSPVVLYLPKISAVIEGDRVRVTLSNDNDEGLVQLGPEDRIVLSGENWRQVVRLGDLDLATTLSPGQRSRSVVLRIPDGERVSRVRFEHVDQGGTCGTDVVPKLRPGTQQSGPGDNWGQAPISRMETRGR